MAQVYTFVAVYDQGVQAFMRPWFVRTKGEAIRIFTDETNRKGGENNALSTHPEDYSLYFLGTWDDTSGKIEQPEIPEKLIEAQDVFV